MKRRIVISLLLVCLFCSGCIEVEYSSSAKLSLYPKRRQLKKLDKQVPEIIGYDYPHYLKTIQELKRVEPIEVKEEPVRIVFTKFTN